MSFNFVQRYLETKKLCAIKMKVLFVSLGAVLGMKDKFIF